MVTFAFVSIAVLSACASVVGAATVPVPWLNGGASMFNHAGLTPMKSSTEQVEAPVTERAVFNNSNVDFAAAAAPAAPRFVIYSDEWVSGLTGPPAVSTVNVRPYTRSIDCHTHSCFRVSTFCMIFPTICNLAPFTYLCNQYPLLLAHRRCFRQGSRMDPAICFPKIDHQIPIRGSRNQTHG